jgi:hypothetical protein
LQGLKPLQGFGMTVPRQLSTLNSQLSKHVVQHKFFLKKNEKKFVGMKKSSYLCGDLIKNKMPNIKTDIQNWFRTFLNMMAYDKLLCHFGILGGG